MIIENRTRTIRNKIFASTHILQLAHLFQLEYDNTLSNITSNLETENLPILNFHLKCFESISFESDSDDIFKSGSKIYTKSIKTIEMTFTYGDERRIKLVIQQGDSYASTGKYTKTLINNSYLEISGKNEFWVNGMLSKLLDYLQSVPEQKRGILDHMGMILLSLVIIVTYLVIMLISLNMCRNDPNYFVKDFYLREGFPITILIILLLALPSLLFIALPILSYIDDVKQSAFPSVELQVGPEHMLIAKLKKKKLTFIWSTIILPVILSIICNIVTNYI